MGKLKREHERKKSLVLRKEEMGSAIWAQVASCVEAWREPAKDSDRGRRHPVERHQECLLDLKVILRSHSQDRPSARPAREGACLHGNSGVFCLAWLWHAWWTWLPTSKTSICTWGTEQVPPPEATFPCCLQNTGSCSTVQWRSGWQQSLPPSPSPNQIPTFPRQPF